MSDGKHVISLLEIVFSVVQRIPEINFIEDTLIVHNNININK